MVPTQEKSLDRKQKLRDFHRSQEFKTTQNQKQWGKNTIEGRGRGRESGKKNSGEREREERQRWKKRE